MKRFFVTLEQSPEYFPFRLPVTDDFVVRHLSAVLRLKPSDQVIIVDDQREIAYLAQIEALGKKEAILSVLAPLAASPDPLPHTTLAASLIKEQRWDLLLQKVTELGVRTIQPLVSERCIIRLSSGDIAKKMERWGNVVRSAAEQSEGLFIPTILPPVTLPDFLSGLGDSSPAPLRLVLMERGPDRFSLKNAFNQAKAGQPLLMALGPEGGWTDGEQHLFLNANFLPVKLGQRILRTETAAMMAMAALVANQE